MAPKKTNPTGRNYDFYEKINVTSGSFSNNSDVTISFPTNGLMLFNEDTGNKVVEYSFNGTTVAGELVSGATSPSRMLTFYNRKVLGIWFRLKTGSSGTVVVRVDAWN